MNCTTENINDLELGVIIEIEPSDYMAEVESEIKKFRQKANIPGFRPGKVPVGMIKKMYGKSIKADIINKTVSDNLEKHLKDNNIKYLGEPIINEEKSSIDIEKDEIQKFYFEIGIQPEIDLKAIKVKAKQYEIEATEKQIDEEVTQLTKRYGSVDSPETIGAADLVTGEFIYSDDNDTATPEQTSIFVDLITDAKIKKAFVDKKTDETIKFDVKKAFKDPKHVAKALNIKESEVENAKSEILFTAKSISRLTPSEINEDLFKKAFPEKEIKTEEEFKAAVKEVIEKEFTQYSERKFVDDTIKEIIDNSGIKLPEEFLKRWMIRTNDTITEENVDDEYERANQSIKWQLIENALVKENNIAINMDSVKDYIREFYRGYFKSSEAPTDEETINENLEKIVDQAIQNKEDVKKIYESLFDQKITEAIKKLVKPKLEKISFDDFVKL
ncbi:MAG: trigger factor [Bacteroidales bacterium]|nr:trigger factor [Bacteroidales bacterium]